MGRLASTAALAALAVSALGGTAGAAGWAPGTSLAPGGNEIAPVVAIDASGTATVAWYGSSNGAYYELAQRIGSDGTVGALQQLSDGTEFALSASVGVGDDGRATVAWLQVGADGNVAMARAVDASGPVGPVLTLSDPTAAASSLRVAVAPDGTATAVWTGTVAGDLVVDTRQILPDGTLGDVHQLAVTGADDGYPSVGIDPRTGAALVVWTQFIGTGYGVETDAIAPDGTPAATPQEVPVAGSLGTPVAVTVDNSGVATLAWDRWDGGNVRVDATRIAADGTVGVTQELSAAGESGNSPAVAVDADGTATVAWSRSDGTNAIVQAARVAADGTPGTPIDLSAPGGDATLPQVAVAADGTASLAWLRSNGTKHVAQERDLAADGTPGAVHDFTDGQVDDAGGPQVAVGGGARFAAWYYPTPNTPFNTAQVSVFDTTPPTASASIPATATAGTPVTMTASASDAAGIASVDWSFGDGSADATGDSVTQTYAQAGDKDVTVTVTDTMGNTSVLHGTVAVAPAPPPVTTTDQTPPPPPPATTTEQTPPPPATQPPPPPVRTAPAKPVGPRSVAAVVHPQLVSSTPRLPIGCRADRGTLRSCTVTLTVRGPGGHALKIGGGALKLHKASRTATVVTKLTAAGRRAIDRVGGVSVTVMVRSIGSNGRVLLSTRTIRLLPPHVVAVPTDGLFATDSATIGAAGARFVGSVADGLREARTIACVGYTDDTGSAAHNLALGLDRAQAVCAQLHRAGIKATLSARSAGEAHPVASNGTAAGRARNRRVELEVSY